MKREHLNTALAVLAAVFIVFAAGCASVQPDGVVMEPIENYGGGGGDGGSAS